MVSKVLAYIVRGDELLVFRHRDYPEAGLQVPAGTIEQGECSRSAVLREVYRVLPRRCLRQEPNTSGARMLVVTGWTRAWQERPFVQRVHYDISLGFRSQTELLLLAEQRAKAMVVASRRAA